MKAFMGYPRVIVPRIGVSFERTRELFWLSASDAAKVTRLADRAFGQSNPYVSRTSPRVTLRVSANVRGSGHACRTPGSQTSAAVQSRFARHALPARRPTS